MTPRKGSLLLGCREQHPHSPGTRLEGAGGGTDNIGHLSEREAEAVRDRRQGAPRVARIGSEEGNQSIAIDHWNDTPKNAPRPKGSKSRKGAGYAPSQTQSTH